MEIGYTLTGMERDEPSAHFAKNLELLARSNPVQAYSLERIDYTQMQPCSTFQGEMNLVDRSSKESAYLYSSEGALWEADNWAENLKLPEKDVLFVYGLGLGYYYLPLKSWLREDPERYLVFVEDDMRVLPFFLGTPLATEILEHPQVIIKLMPELRLRESMTFEEFWAMIRSLYTPFFSTFLDTRFLVSALQSYFFSRTAFFNELITQWHVIMSLDWMLWAEVQLEPNHIFANFYADLPYIAGSSFAEDFFGSFASLPAIICGAGPSITKHLPALAGMRDQALILAAGSGMNAVTRAHVMPHAGGGIDPNEAQASRMATSFAFEVPIFFETRFYGSAITQWHGPRVWVPGGIEPFGVQRWFEKYLGIEGHDPIYPGVSTSNFLLELAGKLGCNPIILIGMDLAYTHDKRYAEGVLAHSTDKKELHSALNYKEDKLLEVDGVNGRVFTKHGWVMEALSIMDFHNRNPQIALWNATEGGMPVENVPNRTFQEVTKDISQESWDMQGWLHGHMQNSLLNVSFSNIVKAMEVWRSSLENCLSLLNALEYDLEANFTRLASKELLPFGPYSGRTALWQEDLHQEIAYQNLLNVYDELFEIRNYHHWRKCQYWRTGPKKQKRLLEIELERTRFLRKFVVEHLQYVQNSLSDYENRFKQLSKRKNEQKNSPVFSHPEYTPPEGTISKLRHYSDGALMTEAFYKGELLEGPWTFYAREGRILSRSWFVDGKREGVSAYYYQEGGLYSQQSYHQGIATGEHLYYYADGTLKTRLNYHEGKFDGLIQLYFRNGQLQKEAHFSKGTLQGWERMWSEGGQLLLESFYENGQTVGISRRWDAEGKLIKEIKA